MVATSLGRVSNWMGVLAAMVYFATFLSFSYAIYAVVRGASFLDSLAFAYPRALGACVLLFLCFAAFEAVKTTVKKARSETKRVAVHSYIPR